LLDCDKKLKDHKRTIKKLSQKVLELSDSLQTTKSTSENVLENEGGDVKEEIEEEKLKTEDNLGICLKAE
jgi:archaellum component FlaC